MDETKIPTWWKIAGLSKNLSHITFIGFEKTHIPSPRK